MSRRGREALRPERKLAGLIEVAAPRLQPRTAKRLLHRAGCRVRFLDVRKGVKTTLLSTLMHEIAHIELKQAPNRVEVSETQLLLLSDFSAEQEEEADWLAGSLLVPRCALMKHRARGCLVSEIAQLFGVSDDLCSWRLRMDRATCSNTPWSGASPPLRSSAAAR